MPCFKPPVTRSSQSIAAGAPARPLWLHVVAGPDQGRRVTAHERTISIGRGEDNALRLTDRLVSRHHCQLTLADHTYVLRDGGSRNGTFVNGVKVVEVAIAPGCQLELGDTRVWFGPADRTAASEGETFGGLIGTSASMREAIELLRSIGVTRLTCLLLGETGTGKELAARALHAQSPQALGPFVVIDCASVNESLIEEKLFGHVRGAFTGAVRDVPGAFEEAHAGTIFLDEIGELPLALQPKLLRVLERREVTRLGSHRNVPLDVRVLAATHRELRAMVASGTFREDLYYRLSEATVRLPPLRERPEDVGLLARHLLEQEWGQSSTLKEDGIAWLRRQEWPGNVREMRNVLRRACAMAQKAPLDARLFERVLQQAGPSTFRPVEPETSPCMTGHGLPIARARDEFRKEYLKQLVDQHGEDHVAVARQMGVHIKYARRLMRRYGLIT
ncbi:MAG: sigma 54-interacting transcriptional regulator [Myxococcota bacterium]|nr:sigma 54-interacting transcriptional regulator [Myxococcota bacterium]